MQADRLVQIRMRVQQAQPLRAVVGNLDLVDDKPAHRHAISEHAPRWTLPHRDGLTAAAAKRQPVEHAIGILYQAIGNCGLAGRAAPRPEVKSRVDADAIREQPFISGVCRGIAGCGQEIVV